MQLFGPGTDSGTFDYFTAEINGEEGASRTDYSPSEDDNVIVQGVTGSPGGLGYFGYTYFEENADNLTAVEIDSGDGCVAPSAETAQDGTYTPLSRPLFIYPSAEAVESKPEVAAFVEYYVDEQPDDRRGGALHPAELRAGDRPPGRTGAAEQRRRRIGGADLHVTITSTGARRGPPQAAPGTPLGRSRPRWGERVIEAILVLAALVSIATTVAIVVALLPPTLEFFSEVSVVDFLTGTNWAPLFADASFGVLPLVAGTLVITVIAVLVCVPLGLGSAIYLSEYATPECARRSSRSSRCSPVSRPWCTASSHFSSSRHSCSRCCRSRSRSTTRCPPGSSWAS